MAESYTFRQKLHYNFQKQADFARKYSPLYRRIHRHVSSWLDAVTADSDPIVTWLEATLAGRSPFLGPNLLTAGLHQRVLADDPLVADLATFYPGSAHFGRANYRFDMVLREAILATRTKLTPFMQTANVQTNETSRGFTWLWPLHYVGWESVHLLDLGASAGLNLVAPLRRYEVADVAGRSLMRLGHWPDEMAAPQFRIRAQGVVPDLPLGDLKPLPRILSRTGIDMQPFYLDSEEQERILLSFIWADQLERMGRLREGLTAYHQVQQGDTPIALHEVFLPDGLADFLATKGPAGDAPLVIYNTYMTTYLPDKGASLREIIGRWAAGQPQPTFWLQLEPRSEASRFGWCAITADLWHNGQHRQWELAMAHPHITDLEFSAADLADFLAYW
ncbi:MAG: DUF2332 domain-containing protein [Ardenticatenales bacterium]|nr:DUF2332 domain-containing protein [Ardenticatenales bacterium]